MDDDDECLLVFLPGALVVVETTIAHRKGRFNIIAQTTASCEPSKLSKLLFSIATSGLSCWDQEAK